MNDQIQVTMSVQEWAIIAEIVAKFCEILPVSRSTAYVVRKFGVLIQQTDDPEEVRV